MPGLRGAAAFVGPPHVRRFDRFRIVGRVSPMTEGLSRPEASVPKASGHSALA